MTGISQRRRGAASWLRAGAAVLAVACGGRAGPEKGVDPSAARVVPLSSAIVLETAGPPPSDTTVTFTAGQPRVIVLRHGPPENVVFAELMFPPSAFRADSGRPVRVEVRPRPGVYGLDLLTSVPLGEGASVVFKYARYFSAPARARAAYGSDVLYERALAVGQYRAGGAEVVLLPSTRPVPDNLRAALPAAGTYVVAAAP
jgi:hypothetical protein